MPFITKLGSVAARAYGWLASVAQAVVSSDTYFYLVSMLLPGNGTNGAQNNTFLDSSTNNFTITRNGNTTQGTFSPFSQTGWSNYFDGTGDFLTFPQNAAFNLATVDFTIEGWVYYTSTPAAGPVFAIDTTSFPSVLIQNESGVLKVYATSASGSWDILNGASFGSISANSWAYFALTRSGSTFRTFLNGVLGATVTSSTAIENQGGTGRIGASDINVMNGYISNFRLVKGTALYVTAFAPPTAPLTAVSGTSLLTCQSNRFVDNSANRFAITRNGDISVTANSPFAPNNFTPASYSGYFDGAGDYLTVPASAATNFIGGSFTLEVWYYPQSFVNYALLMMQDDGGSPSQNFQFRVDSGGLVNWISFTTTARASVWILNSTSAVTLNQWNHIAVSYDGTTTRLFIGGAAVGTSTSSYWAGAAIQTAIGNYSAGSSQTVPNALVNGYISNLRIVKGTAVYTAAFTPPTAPLTAITNTSLLTLQNATFIDNSTNAFAITVNGNSQPITNNPFQTPSPNPISYSGYFDGTGDWLTISDSPALDLPADFTIETWVYITENTNRAYSIVGKWGAPYAWILSANPSTGAITFSYGNSGTFVGTATFASSFSSNRWANITVTRSGSSVRAFLDGAQIGTTQTITSNLTASTVLYIGRDDGITRNFVGSSSNIRVIKGTALYTSNFIPPNTPLTAVSGTSLLTCQNNRFVDNSSNAFAITVNGNTTPVMTNPYGYATPISSTAYSGAFDGGTTTRLTFPSNTAFAFGTGAYTMEAWVYLTSYAPTFSIAIFDCGSATNSAGMVVNITGTLVLNLFGTGPVLQTSTTVPLNTWTHIAISRQSTAASSTRLFINGVLGATGTDSNNWTVTTTPSVGGLNLAGYTVTGFVSNVRVVKGTAVYTAAFTPPTAPLTAISGTSLLTCQNIVFADNSSNAFTVTVNGNAATTPVNPFGYSAPAAPTPVSYSALINGGSGYFDGTGDFLIISGAPFSTTGDFTIESWIYPTSTTGGNLFAFRTESATGYAACRLIVDTNQLQLLLSTNNSSWTINSGLVGVASVTMWSHIAITRNGGSITLFVNGVSVFTSTAIASGTALMTGTNNYIGVVNFTPGGGFFSYFYGFASNFRVVNGTAVYTSNFAPPTAPVTAITNTSLLLNYTNAGIYDAASQNVLETIGNAQISTAQSKWGGGSMAFDGTGDYLTVPDSPAWFLGTGNFTIEFWIYFSSTASLSMLVQQGLNANNRWILYYSTTTGMSFDVASASAGIISCQQGSTAGWATNTWYHVALVRNGNAFNIYRNGTSIASATDTDSIPDFAGLLYIGGGAFPGDVSLNGYIDDLRITKFARYTANFTPPTAAFPTQ